ncbi:MAG: hypothetical protein ACLVKR_03695 [Lachnospiraceae bacterium]
MFTTKLLYLVAEKDYESDGYIRNDWETVQQAIDESYMVTIFGYNAPFSDKSTVIFLAKGGDIHKNVS